MKKLLATALVTLAPGMSGAQVTPNAPLAHLTLEDFSPSILRDTISSVPYGLPSIRRSDVLVGILEAHPEFISPESLYLWSLISSDEGCATRDMVNSGAISAGDVVRQVVSNGVSRNAEMAVTGSVSYNLLPRSRIVNFSQDSMEEISFPEIDSGSCPEVLLSVAGRNAPLVQSFSVSLPDRLPPLFLGERETRAVILASEISRQDLQLCMQLSGSGFSVTRRSHHSFDVALEVDRVRVGSECVQQIEWDGSWDLDWSLTSREDHLADYIATAVFDHDLGEWIWGIETPFIDADGRPGFDFEPIVVE